MVGKNSRRVFLRATGVCLALPWLERFAPRVLGEQTTPRRMVCVCLPLGIHAGHFFPKQAGAEYELPPYLELLKAFRKQFTVISGLHHPDVGPSHDSFSSFLTAAPHPEFRAGFRNTISLDQFAADHLRGATRFPSLSFSVEGSGLSWTRSGASVPSDFSPARVFRRLFLDGTKEEVRAEINRLRDGRSILDMLGSQRRSLDRKLGPDDRQKMDEYLTSVRELESQLALDEQWSKKPKPKVEAKIPQDVTNNADILQQNRLWFDLIHLALQTDSTRLITVALSGLTGTPLVPGVSLGYHDLSHHGQDANKLAQLRTVELAQMTTLRDFLQKLNDTKEAGQSLLDRTMVFYSSNLGNASSHDVKNLPVLLAGGGFRHGQSLQFPKGQPLANLFVSMLQRLEINVDRFASGSSRLTGLEMS